jgi:hypothetical protein
MVLGLIPPYVGTGLMALSLREGLIIIKNGFGVQTLVWAPILGVNAISSRVSGNPRSEIPETTDFRGFREIRGAKFPKQLKRRSRVSGDEVVS